MEAFQGRLWGQPVKIETQEPIKYMSDPRPDLENDSRDWERLLNMANEKNKNLTSILHGFRCGGLRIYKIKLGHVLRPEFNSNSLWQNHNDYEKDRDKWLMEYKNEIVDLLNKLGQS